MSISSPRTRFAETGRALDADAPLVWPEAGSKQGLHLSVGDPAKAQEAFARAAQTCPRSSSFNNRLVSNYMGSAIGDRPKVWGSRTRTGSNW